MVVRVSCERRSNGLVGIFDARSLGRGSLSNVARGRKEEAHLEIFALKSSRFPEKYGEEMRRHFEREKMFGEVEGGDMCACSGTQSTRECVLNAFTPFLAFP